MMNHINRTRRVKFRFITCSVFVWFFSSLESVYLHFNFDEFDVLLLGSYHYILFLHNNQSTKIFYCNVPRFEREKLINHQ